MITPRNALRLAAARQVLLNRAAEKQVRPIIYTAQDKYKGKVLEDTYKPIADLIADKNPNQTGNCLKHFMYVQGEDYYITTNQLPAGPELNCANGSQGTAVGIILHDDEPALTQDNVHTDGAWHLKLPPKCVLLKMHSPKHKSLPGVPATLGNMTTDLPTLQACQKGFLTV